MCAVGSKKAGQAIGAILSLMLALAAANQTKAERLPIKSYTTADGLARDQINRIKQDSRGFLWFCTREGLSRFDGYRFTNYTTAQGLPHRNVTDLLETRNGVYWVATDGGVCLFNPTGSPGAREVQTTKDNESAPKPMFITYRPDDKRTNYFSGVLEDHAGTIWCGTSDGLYSVERVDDSWRFRRVEIGTPSIFADDARVWAMLEDRQGTLWVVTSSGLYRRYTDGRVERYTTRDGLPALSMTTLMEDREGRVWAGAREGGVALVVPGQAGKRSTIVRVYSKADGLGANWITALFQSSDGRLWVGTMEGLCEFIPRGDRKKQSFRTYTTEHGLNGSNEVTAIAEDRDGNIWLASDGAMKISRNGFTSYHEADGLIVRDKPPAMFLENHAGELCVVTNVQDVISLNRFDGGRFTAIRPNIPRHISYMGWGTHQIVLQDHAGEWWISTGGGLCRYPKVKDIKQLAGTRPKAVYTTRDGLYSNLLFRIFEDSHGDIWMSTMSYVAAANTLMRWERAAEKFHRYSTADGVPNIAPTSFCEDALGNLWIGFYDGGLARYAAGRFTFFATSEGVPPGFIWHLYRDDAGRLWVASGEGGLARIDDPGAEAPSFVTYTVADGLASNQIYCIAEDQWGRLYLATGRGVDRFDPLSGQIKHYTNADGLPSNTVRLGFRDRRGMLWFGGKGISRLMPELEQPGQPPPVLIGGLRIPGVSYRVSELGEKEISLPDLGPSQNQIQIDFFGLSFAIGESLEYQYKIEGAGQDWSAPTQQRVVNLSLSPGAYRFLVRAMSADGTASQTPAIVSFRILSPVWQRWWFITIAASLAGLMIYAAVRYRVARLIELERVRTRIATDLHDDIGSNLSLIAIVTEVARDQAPKDSPDVIERLALVARTSRQSVDAMSDIVWAVNPKRDHLHDLIERMRRFASDTFTACDIEFQFSAPGANQDLKLGADLRRQVYMIFKESINNIAKHSGCTQADIDVGMRGGHLILRLSDNGKGFDIAGAAGGYGGNGLISMRRRADALGGELEIVSSQGAGTTVALKVRL